ASLVARTARTAALVAAGQGPTLVGVSASVAALLEGALPGLSRLKVLAVLLALALAGGAGGLATRLPAGAPADRPLSRIEKLIRSLGSGAYAEREAAARELDALGERALGPLRKAAGTGDLEGRKRAALLAAGIERRIARATVLIPRKVRLKYA